MPNARYIPPSAETNSQIYHCVSRVVNREFVFKDTEKRMFVAMMRKYETFCDIRVLAFCVMGNHFHILAEIPPKKKGAALDIPDDEFMSRIRALYSTEQSHDIEHLLDQFRSKGQHQSAEQLKASYTYRMHDLSEFFKGLKQRFTRWFNHQHNRKGTLWETRFKSTLVCDPHAIKIIAAYIDLNPVRAGMTNQPETYPWSSYGQAMGAGPQRGIVRARQGIAHVLIRPLTQKPNSSNQQATPAGVSAPPTKIQWNSLMPTKTIPRKHPANTPNPPVKLEKPPTVAEYYRMLLYGQGEAVYADLPSQGKKRQLVRQGIDPAKARKVLAQGGKLTLAEALLCRVRYFTSGTCIGGKESLEKVFQSTRERFSAARTTGARPLRQIEWPENTNQLYSLRDIVKDRYE